MPIFPYSEKCASKAPTNDDVNNDNDKNGDDDHDNNKDDDNRKCAKD